MFPRRLSAPSSSGRAGSSSTPLPSSPLAPTCGPRPEGPPHSSQCSGGQLSSSGGIWSHRWGDLPQLFCSWADEWIVLTLNGGRTVFPVLMVGSPSFSSPGLNAFFKPSLPFPFSIYIFPTPPFPPGKSFVSRIHAGTRTLLTFLRWFSH